MVSNNTLALVGKTQIGKRTIGMSDSNGVVTKASMGVKDSWYGGMVKEFRKIKNSGILMCLDKRDNIINLAYIPEQLNDTDRRMLGMEVEEVVEEVVEEFETVSGTWEHTQVEGMSEVVYSEKQDPENFNPANPKETKPKPMAKPMTKNK